MPPRKRGYIEVTENTTRVAVPLNNICYIRENPQGLARIKMTTGGWIECNDLYTDVLRAYTQEIK